MCATTRSAAIMDKYQRGDKPAAGKRPKGPRGDDWYQTKPRGSKLGNGNYIWRG
jgi:hypothetical protein